MQIKLTGKIHDYYDFKEGFLEPEDLQEGDLLVQPKLDQGGRIAAQGGHANRGYSGYFLGFLYADGGARKFLKWIDLWPIAENTFKAQQDKSETLQEMQKTVTRLAGSDMVKVKGGWQLQLEVNEILGRKPAA